MGLLSKKELLGLILTTGLLGLLIYLADTEKIIESIYQIDNSFIALGFLLGVFVLLFRSLVWFLFLNKLDLGLSIFETLRLFSAGEFMNNITPLGQAGGQPFMAYIISKNAGLNYEKSLTAVVSADVISGTPLVSFSLISVIYFLATGQASQIIYNAAIFATAGLLTILALLYAIEAKMNDIKKYSEMLFHKLKILDKWEDKIRQKARGVEESLEFFLNDYQDLLKSLLFGHLAYLAEFTILTMFLVSVGFNENILYLFIIFPLANISKSAPTSGGSGVYEFAMAGIIDTISSISFSASLTAVFLYRLTTYWNAILVGYIALQGLTYRRQ